MTARDERERTTNGHSKVINFSIDWDWVIRFKRRREKQTKEMKKRQTVLCDLFCERYRRERTREGDHDWTIWTYLCRWAVRTVIWLSMNCFIRSHVGVISSTKDSLEWVDYCYHSHSSPVSANNKRIHYKKTTNLTLNCLFGWALKWPSLTPPSGWKEGLQRRHQTKCQASNYSLSVWTVRLAE